MIFHTLRTLCLLGVALPLGTLANPTSVSVKHSSTAPAAGVASGKAKAVSQSLGPAAAAAAAAAAPSLVGEPGQTVMICDPGTTKNCAIETPKLGVKPICHTLKQYTSGTGMGGFIILGNALSCKFFSDSTCLDGMSFTLTSGVSGDAASGWRSAPGWPEWNMDTSAGPWQYRAYACKGILNDEVDVVRA